MRLDFPKDFKLVEKRTCTYKYIGKEPWVGKLIVDGDRLQLQGYKQDPNFIIKDFEINIE